MEYFTVAKASCYDNVDRGQETVAVDIFSWIFPARHFC